MLKQSPLQSISPPCLQLVAVLSLSSEKVVSVFFIQNITCNLMLPYHVSKSNISLQVFIICFIFIKSYYHVFIVLIMLKNAIRFKITCRINLHKIPVNLFYRFRYMLFIRRCGCFLGLFPHA